MSITNFGLKPGIWRVHVVAYSLARCLQDSTRPEDYLSPCSMGLLGMMGCACSQFATFVAKPRTLVWAFSLLMRVANPCALLSQPSQPPCAPSMYMVAWGARAEKVSMAYLMPSLNAIKKFLTARVDDVDHQVRKRVRFNDHHHRHSWILRQAQWQTDRCTAPCTMGWRSSSPRCWKGWQTHRGADEHDEAGGEQGLNWETVNSGRRWNGKRATLNLFWIFIKPHPCSGMIRWRLRVYGSRPKMTSCLFRECVLNFIQSSFSWLFTLGCITIVAVPSIYAYWVPVECQWQKLNVNEKQKVFFSGCVLSELCAAQIHFCPCGALCG